MRYFLRVTFSVYKVHNVSFDFCGTTLEASITQTFLQLNPFYKPYQACKTSTSTIGTVFAFSLSLHRYDNRNSSISNPRELKHYFSQTYKPQWLLTPDNSKLLYKYRKIRTICELKLLSKPVVATVVILNTVFFNSVINKLQGTCQFFWVVTKLYKNLFSVKICTFVVYSNNIEKSYTILCDSNKFGFSLKVCITGKRAFNKSSYFHQSFGGLGYLECTAFSAFSAFKIVLSQ